MSHEPPLPSSTDIQQFYQAACSAYEVARGQAANVDPIWLELGGTILRLSFAGEAMMPNILPALEHLRVSPQPKADLDIGIWDSASTNCEMPPPPWSSGDYIARGEIRDYGGDGFAVAYNPGSGVLSMLPEQSGKALYWAKDASRCPYWEQAAPLRTLFHWWCSRRDQQLVHGAAVGIQEGAIMLTGKGGSGKSTTALSALLAGLDYIGDDYVLCELNDTQAAVHSLFNTAKLDANALRYLPELGKKLVNAEQLEHEKGVLFTQEYYPQQVCRSRPLRAIVIPRVAGSATPRMLPLKPLLAYLALSPTTVFQLPGAKEQALAFLKRLVERLPCYQMELGREPMQNAALIRGFIRQSV